MKDLIFYYRKLGIAIIACKGRWRPLRKFGETVPVVVLQHKKSAFHSAHCSLLNSQILQQSRQKYFAKLNLGAASMK